MNTDAKALSKNLASGIQPYKKMKMLHDEVWFIPGIQGWFDLLKPI